jgi:hypothetical protein
MQTSLALALRAPAAKVSMNIRLRQWLKCRFNFIFIASLPLLLALIVADRSSTSRCASGRAISASSAHHPVLRIRTP